MIDLASPALRADVLRLLMGGARAGTVLRLLASDLAQLERGFSYVLREDGAPLAVAGFWPVDSPPPALAARAAGRPVYLAWLIAGEGLVRHAALAVRLARGKIATLAASGALVAAEVDHSHKSAVKLARLCGLVPRLALEGHDVWTSDVLSAGQARAGATQTETCHG